MDTTWPLSAAVVGLIILQVGLARHQLGSWLAPGAFFGLMWATVGVLSLSIAPEFRIWPGILWVFFMSCTAHLGGLLVFGGESSSDRTSASEEVASQGPPLPLALPLLLASAILGTAGVVYLVSSSGRPLSTLLSVSAVSAIASHFSGLRYSAPDYREPTAFLVLSVFTYLAGYLGGMIFARRSSGLEKLAALSGVVPALLETFALGARTCLIVFVMCWIASYCATRAYIGERRLWPNWRRALTTMGLGIIALTGLYVTVHMTRTGAFTQSSIPVSTLRSEALLKYSLGAAKVQFVGYAAAFSKWFGENWDVWQTPGLGRYSFDGPAGWLGYRVVRNPEPINVSPHATAHYSDTNIFSTFRHMALDWTLPGSSIFFLILSALASLAYVKVCGHNAGYIPLTVLYYQIALNVTGFALRPTVTDVAWILFASYLWLVSGAESLRLLSPESGIGGSVNRRVKALSQLGLSVAPLSETFFDRPNPQRREEMPD